MVAGGLYLDDGWNYLSSVDIFDPTTNKWIAGKKKLHFFENRNQIKHKVDMHAI